MSKKTSVKPAAKKSAAAVKKSAPVAKKAAAKSSKKSTAKKSDFGGLSEELLLSMHEMMVKSRVLEERVIKIYKAGDGYFWIGGPGEEAFGVPRGLLVRKGQGLAYDWMHLHYRCTPTMVALGMPMIEAVRLMMNRVTDPSTGGRNFAGHYCFPQWNVAPVTSPIEVQYPTACGTAHAQKRAGHKAISIVSGGDAGTAEGDFASCLVWSSRKGQELPLLITVQNNGFGISTPYEGQHGESQIADRAKAFNIRSRVINGTDPVETYIALQEEMEYIRKTGKPSFLEVKTTRLYGHSSADGANRKTDLFDPVLEFEKKLISAGLLSKSEAQKIWEKYEEEGVQAQEQARGEASPSGDSVWDHVYVNNENADWRKILMASIAQAIRMALHYGEKHLGVKDIFGQDVGAPLGGVFTATQGLKTAWNTPLDERGIIGMAMGIAMTGDRCVAEIQFGDYIFNTIDLLKMAGNTLWVTNGQVPMPMVVMTPVGAGIFGSIYHSHSFDAWASRLPGWKIVMPSNPLDAYGLMLAAIQDPNPVLYLKSKALMRHKGDELIPGEPADEKELKAMIDKPVQNSAGWKPRWPDLQEYIVPIGKGKITHAGEQITIVTYSRMVHLCNEVAEKLSHEGISVEVIDLRSIYPYDWQMIKESVEKTGRVLFVNEDTEVTNFGEHLAYRVTQECFYQLMARPRVLAGKNLPGIGLSPNLEKNSVPQYNDIETAVREIVAEVP